MGWLTQLFTPTTNKKGGNRTGRQDKGGGGSHGNREDKARRGSGENHTQSNPGRSGGSRSRGGRNG
jgi:hypothetical protein